MSALLLLLAALFSPVSGEISAILLLFAVALVVVLAIDDDDLPGPRLCRVAANRA